MFLGFSVQGYEFETGLKALKEAYEISYTAISEKIDQEENNLKEYQQGDEFIGERDEEGYVLWEKDTEIEFKIKLLKESIYSLNRSFTVIYFHFWEKSVLQWAKPYKEIIKKKKKKIEKKNKKYTYNEKIIRHLNSCKEKNHIFTPIKMK